MSEKSVKGVGGILSAALLFTCMATGTKFAAGYGVQHWETTLFRFASGFMVLGILWGVGAIRIVFHNCRWLIMRGIFGGTAICCYFFALSYGTLANAVVLNASYPVFVALFSSMFIGERVRGFVFPVLIAAFAGIVMIIRPSPGEVNIADLAALASAVLAALGILSIRRLRQTENVWTILFALNGIGMIISAVGLITTAGFSAYEPKIPSYMGWVAIIAVALASNLAQVCLTYAYRFIRASEGSILIKTSVVLSAAIGYFVFGEPITVYLVAGATLVLGSSITLTLLIHRAEAKESGEGRVSL